MKTSQLIATASLLAGVTFGFIASTPNPAAADATREKPVRVRLAYVTQPTHSFGIGARAFTEKLAELTDGRYQVQEFPAGALGGERENVEQLQVGALEISITTSGVMANFVPEIGILDIPFLFKNYEHAHAVLDGEVGDELLKKLNQHGIVGLAWGESGFRQLANDVRPVVKPDDLKGIKLRTMEVPEHIKAFETLGAKPTPIAFPEVYTALQQGTVDAVESPTQTMLTSKFYEVQGHLSLTNHLYAASAFLASKNFFSKLPQADQEAFRQAAIVGSEAQRNAVIKNEEEQLAELRQKGMEVVTEVDTAAFQATLAPAYAEFANKFGKAKIDHIKNYEY